MTLLSKKALEILQANTDKQVFTNSILIEAGFSEATAKTAIKELDRSGYIFIETTYIDGSCRFSLL